MNRGRSMKYELFCESLCTKGLRFTFRVYQSQLASYESAIGLRFKYRTPTPKP